MVFARVSGRLWLAAALLGTIVALPHAMELVVFEPPVEPIGNLVTVDNKSPMYGAGIPRGVVIQQQQQQTTPEDPVLSRADIAAMVARNASLTDPPSSSGQMAAPPTSDPPSSPTDGGDDALLDAPSLAPDVAGLAAADGNDTTTTGSVANATDVRVLGAAQVDLPVVDPELRLLQKIFQNQLIMSLFIDKLDYMKQEAEPVPWPGSYWPMYQDGINARWDPHARSPAEKYARAFGLNAQQFMNRISAAMGVDSQAKSSRPCWSSADCPVGVSCGKRAGRSRGYCIPKWYGISHGWAPAAFHEAEPRCPVVRHGVTFQPNDIKALVSAVYADARLPALMMGTRYDGPGSGLDEYGRFRDRAQRNLNPAAFHYLTVNLLGRFGHSFVLDVRSDAQVRNQPVRGYEILEIKYMNPHLAAMVFFDAFVYPFNPKAKGIAYVRMKVQYMREMFENKAYVASGQADEATVTVVYEYILELSRPDHFGLILGGQWVRGSKKNHPDFLWYISSFHKPKASTVTPVGLEYAKVLDLVQASHAC